MIWFLPLFLLAACSTVENDFSTNSVESLYGTRIDFQPPTRTERDRQIAFEKVSRERKEVALRKQMDELAAARLDVFANLKKKFPECREQKHCQSSLTMGSTKRFEEYRDARLPLAKIDSEIAGVESQLELSRRRYELRARAIYNRYLVRQVLDTPKLDPRLRLTVHALEAYPDRLSLSRRLLQLGEPSVQPMLVGELDFRLLGKPVDEASVILILDVTVAQDQGQPKRYLLSLLVNTHQLDPQGYEEGFLRLWARKLVDLETLKEKTYCGLYSIGGAMLLPKLNMGKTKKCGEERMRLQSLTANRFYDVDQPEIWMIPVSLLEL